MNSAMDIFLFMVYLTTESNVSIRVNNELKRILNEAVVTLFEVRSQHLPRVT
jgi:hypothetical protein